MRFKLKLEAADVGYTRLIDDDRLQSQQGWPYGLTFADNRAYFCQQCGRIWAQWVKEGEEGAPFYATNRSCGAHPGGMWNGDRPGSIVLYPLDIPVLSRELLEYEVLREVTTIEY
jgi:hypothetical protein